MRGKLLTGLRQSIGRHGPEGHVLGQRYRVPGRVPVGVARPHDQNSRVEIRLGLADGDHRLTQVYRAPDVDVNRIGREFTCQGAGCEARQVVDPVRHGSGDEAHEGVAISYVGRFPVDGRDLLGSESRSARRQIEGRGGHAEAVLQQFSNEVLPDEAVGSGDQCFHPCHAPVRRHRP